MRLFNTICADSPAAVAVPYTPPRVENTISGTPDLRKNLVRCRRRNSGRLWGLVRLYSWLSRLKISGVMPANAGAGLSIFIIIVCFRACLNFSALALLNSFAPVSRLKLVT